jgi:hypothetical protein
MCTGSPRRGELLDLVPAYAEGRILFREDLTFSELTRRFDAGERLVEVTGDHDGVTPLFILTGSELTIVTAGPRHEPTAGDTTIGLIAPSPESGEARRASLP